MFFSWYAFWSEWNFTYGTPRSQVRLNLFLDLRMTPYLPPWSHAQKYFNKRKLSQCFVIHFDLAFDSVCSLYQLLHGFIYLWFRTTVLCFIHLKKMYFTFCGVYDSSHVTVKWCLWDAWVWWYQNVPSI